MMQKIIAFLKANWAPALLSIWCIWATVKLHRIEANQVTAYDLRDIESTVQQTSAELQEFREEAAKARRDQEFSRLFRR